MTPTVKETKDNTKTGAKEASKEKNISQTKSEKSADKPILIKTPASKKYIYAIGRRKKAVARVRLFTGGSGKISVNNKDSAIYFPIFEMHQMVKIPLEQVGQADKLDATVLVKSGGKKGQAECIRLALSRALVNLNPNFRKALKKAGFLTCDARVRERKKYGLKGARRAPQWQKR